MIQTGTSNSTIWIENGEEVYPCSCGETHRGDYAFYDWIRHICRHGDELWDLSEDGLGMMCSQCGDTVGYVPGDEALSYLAEC
ncbi:MAG: hypothetical protein V3W37_08735 [Candidatus Binatia bacterium]